MWCKRQSSKRCEGLDRPSSSSYSSSTFSDIYFWKALKRSGLCCLFSLWSNTDTDKKEERMSLFPLVFSWFHSLSHILSPFHWWTHNPYTFFPKLTVTADLALSRCDSSSLRHVVAWFTFMPIGPFTDPPGSFFPRNFLMQNRTIVNPEWPSLRIYLYLSPTLSKARYRLVTTPPYQLSPPDLCLCNTLGQHIFRLSLTSPFYWPTSPMDSLHVTWW